MSRYLSLTLAGGLLAFGLGRGMADDLLLGNVTEPVAGVEVTVDAMGSMLPFLDSGVRVPETALDNLGAISPLAPAASLRPVIRDTWAVPVARWDDDPRGPRWTAAVLAALRGPGEPLLDVVPADIGAWCPGYPSADAERRAAFWTGLVSVLAWHESTHEPTAVGGGGQWFGLVQIAPETARWRDCEADTASALLDGPANLRCGIRIMAITVPRDGVVAEGLSGVAADWGPFHSTRKREEMRNWIRRQDYCQSGTRPVMRPEGLTMSVPVAAPEERVRPVLRPAVGPVE